MKSNRVEILSYYVSKNNYFIKFSELDITDGESLKIWLKGVNFLQLLTKKFS
nr:hypothetical protein [Francisella uliginis]